MGRQDSTFYIYNSEPFWTSLASSTWIPARTVLQAAPPANRQAKIIAPTVERVIDIDGASMFGSRADHPGFQRTI